MNKAEQIAFIKSLSECIAIELCAKIGRIPEDWDGHELRVLLAEKHAESARMSHIKDEPRSVRARAYRNTVIVNNL